MNIISIYEIDYRLLDDLQPSRKITESQLAVVAGDEYYRSNKIKKLTQYLCNLIKNTPFVDMHFIAYSQMAVLIRTSHRFSNKTALKKSMDRRTILYPDESVTLSNLKGYTANDFVAGFIYGMKSLLGEMGYRNNMINIKFAKSKIAIDAITEHVKGKYAIPPNTGYYYVKIGL